MAQRISQARFNVLAIGTRLSTVQFISEEISWWANLDEQIIGTVFFEYPDQQYGWVLLARDENQKFRKADLGHSYARERRAEAELRLKIEEMSRSEEFDGIFAQRDNDFPPINLLEPVTQKKEQLHPNFLALLETEGREPSRKVFSEIAPWLFPEDRHFVREFQCHQFDQRIWELYLWATLKEMKYDIAQREAPDFECIAAPIQANFTIEATTVSPSEQGILKESPVPRSPAETFEFVQTYMPIKFGSALTSKLNKTNSQGLHYWEREHSRNKPFIIAIADFHKAADAEKFEFGSMTYSQSGLPIYLYGKKIESYIEDGKMNFAVKDADTHSYLSKEIPSGFFNLQNAENVSGILFSNAGTLSKFDRMGVCAGYGTKDHVYYRWGYKFDPSPEAYVGIPFKTKVCPEKYQELWSDDLQFFHNPNAKHPIPPEWFPNITHHNLIDGEFVSIEAEERVLSSMTLILKLVDGEE